MNNYIHTMEYHASLYNCITTDSLLQYIVRREKYIPYKREAAVAQDLYAHRLCGGKHMDIMQCDLGLFSCSKP